MSNRRTRLNTMRTMLNRASRHNQLGSLAPFITGRLDPPTQLTLIKGVSPMGRLQQKVEPKADVSLDVKVVAKASVIELVTEYETVCTKLAQLKAKKEKLEPQMKALGEKYGKKFETTEGAVVNRIDSQNVSVSKTKLVELGVKASIIEKATNTTPYSYFRVDRKKRVEESL